jgi:D-alanine-D-alanine ligase-like ATP-grasp enzyme
VVAPAERNYVRSYENGWIFAREDVVRNPAAEAAAIAAVASLGLDFGAVDVILREGKAYVLEVNTAPGIEGATLSAYLEAFRHEFH